MEGVLTIIGGIFVLAMGFSVLVGVIAVIGSGVESLVGFIDELRGK